MGADLRSASVVWEAAAGPGWPDADEMMWGAGDGTCVAVVTGVRGRLTVRGVAAETGAVHWKREISPADTRQLWNSLVAGEMPEVERRACVLRRADMLVVALSSNPVRIERTESGEGSTHLSTGQPLVEFVRLDPADGGVMWRTGVARAACASFALSHRFGGLACCDGAISSLDWETGRWVPLTDAGSQPDCLARSGPIVGAVWRERGGLRLATLDTRDGTVRRGEHRERGIARVVAHPAGDGDFLLAINSRTVAFLDASASIRWRDRIGAYVYGVMGAPGSPVFVDAAGAGAALYAFGRGTGEVLVHERSALGAGGDLTLVDGTDLLAVSSSSRRDYGAGGLLVVRTDGTGLRRLDVGHGIVGSYRGAVITMSERDQDCRPLSDDVVVTGVTEG